MLPVLPFSVPLNSPIVSFYDSLFPALELLHADTLLHFKLCDCTITLQTAHLCLIKFGVEFNGGGA